jgi:hypothetical protein
MKDGHVANNGTFCVSGSCSYKHVSKLVKAKILCVMVWTNRVIGDQMVHVVAAFPPSYRQSAAEVRNEHCNQTVSEEIVRYASMTCIMGSKHDLVLSRGQY